jgi:hypothetical protein
MKESHNFSKVKPILAAPSSMPLLMSIAKAGKPQWIAIARDTLQR